MITIVAHMRCAQGTDDEILAAAVDWFIPAVLAEPGCIEFRLHRQIDDRTRFVWHEVFVDRAAVALHVASAAVAQWFTLIKRLGAHNEYRLYERVGALAPVAG